MFPVICAGTAVGLIILHFVTDAMFFPFATTHYNRVSSLYETNEALGFWTRPNLDEKIEPGKSFTWKHLNNKGFREELDSFPTKDREDTLRCIAFGDSIFFGFGVPYGSGLCELLETEFSPMSTSMDPGFELINTAIPCLNPSHYIILWDQMMRDYQADMVMVGVCPNDPYNDYKFAEMSRLAGSDKRKRTRYLADLASGPMVGSKNKLTRSFQSVFQWLIPRNSFVSFINRRKLDRLKSERQTDIDEYLKTLSMDKVMEPYMSKLIGLRERLVELPVLWVVFPSESYLSTTMGKRCDSPYYPFDKEGIYRSKTLDFMSENDLTCLDVLDVFVNYLKENPEKTHSDLYLYAGDVIHPSVLGHRVVAEAVQEKMVKILNEQSPAI